MHKNILSVRQNFIKLRWKKLVGVGVVTMSDKIRLMPIMWHHFGRVRRDLGCETNRVVHQGNFIADTSVAMTKKFLVVAHEIFKTLRPCLCPWCRWPGPNDVNRIRDTYLKLLYSLRFTFGLQSPCWIQGFQYNLSWWLAHIMYMQPAWHTSLVWC